MKNNFYATAVESLMYAQVCIFDVACTIGMLGSLNIDHLKVRMNVINYIQGINNYMLMFWRAHNLEMIG